jgi:ABC-type multidrug transport system fused ATPase/permease subunit
MNKKKFFEVGGYDEDFSGCYGYEETFFYHCMRAKKLKIEKRDDIKLLWFPDLGGTKGLKRDKSENFILFEKKMADLKTRSYKNGPLLRFPWESYKKESFFNDLKQILEFMQKTGIRLRFFSVSVLFSLGLTLFNLYTVSLLFPLVKGIIENNFDHVSSIPVVGAIVHNFPDYFSGPVRTFVLLTVWIYISIILKNILQYAATVSTENQAKEATHSLRLLVLEKFNQFGKSFFDKRRSLNLHSTLTKSSKVIEKQFLLFKNLIIDSFLLIMFLTMMLRISWILTTVSFAIYPIMSILTKKSISRIKELLKDSERAENELSEIASKYVNSLSLIKTFSKEEKEKELFESASLKETRKSFKAKRISALLNPIEDISGTTSSLLLALGMALTIHLTGELDPSGAFVFFYLAQRLVPTLNTFTNFRLGMITSKREIQEINEILTENEHEIIPDGKMDFTGFKEDVEIKNLSFKYMRNDPFVLRDLNLRIPQGKTTALIGPTGSGKSTVINLLLRLYDVSHGSIFFDGIDIKEFKTNSLRNRISYVGQDPILINETILSNITYGANKEISEEDIKRICKMMMVDIFVEKLPKSYNAIIGEKGCNLSGGEKQRISLARALLRDHDLLILDEATSALDAKTEESVLSSIAELSKGKTVVIISHRIASLKNADHVIYMEHGQPREAGSFEEVLNLQGNLYQLWQLQRLS